LEQFNAFKDNWLDCSALFSNESRIAELPVNLPVSFFESLQFDSDTFKKYRIDAAIKCAETLGDNPALCLSGGVDSQAMVQCWTEANLKFKVVTLEFNDGLNAQDVDHASLYCDKHSIELIKIPFDIIKFLTRENYDIGIKYRSPSPHFNTHYRLFELLREQGFTGACAGGVSPLKNNASAVWGTNFEYVCMNFIQFAQISNFPCQGSFLSYDPHLAWAIGLVTPNNLTVHSEIGTNVMTWTERIVAQAVRYNDKLAGFKTAGFDVIPQQQKYTGFELVKKYFEKISGDGWEFEKRFRYPLSSLFLKTYGSPKFLLPVEQSSILDSIYNNNVIASR